MEQNQHANALSQTQQQWKQLRKQFADTEESIQDEQGIELMEQWINLKYNNQFQQYPQNGSNPERIKSLKDVIREAITSQKQTNWIITQKYNLEHAQHLIQKAKEIYQQYKNQNQKLPQAQQNMEKSVNNRSVKSKSRNGSSKLSKRSTEKKQNVQILLPKIKARGKVYNPQEMSSDFQLLQETTQQYKPRSPHIFEADRQVNHKNRSSIFGNRFLKMAFFKFCKQSYNWKGTFSQFSKDEDKMNMNKWMVFCKQFDFTEKFHIKDLIQLYQTSTKFASTMTLDQFLNAVVLLQQKYMDRYHTGEMFVQEVLKINSQAAFRSKMQNLKVSYAGPRKNFFEAAKYPEPLRFQQIQKEKQFQSMKRKKQMVLIQGMYQQHLKDQIKKRKEQRDQRKKGESTYMNQSLIGQKQLAKQVIQQPRYSSKNPQKLTYSSIFQRGKINSQHKTAKPIEFTKLNNSSLYRTQGNKKQENIQNGKLTTRNISGSKKDLNKNILQKNNPEKSDLKNSKVEPRREWVQNNDSVWMTRVRSDSQESDEILKEHLQLQKRIKESHESLKVNKLMKEMQAQSAKVDSIRQKIQQEQIAQTGANFYPKKVQ